LEKREPESILLGKWQSQTFELENVAVLSCPGLKSFGIEKKSCHKFLKSAKKFAAFPEFAEIRLQVDKNRLFSFCFYFLF
jgi:hypothetical protein